MADFSFNNDTFQTSFTDNIEEQITVQTGAVVHAVAASVAPTRTVDRKTRSRAKQADRRRSKSPTASQTALSSKRLRKEIKRILSTTEIALFMRFDRPRAISDEQSQQLACRTVEDQTQFLRQFNALADKEKPAAVRENYCPHLVRKMGYYPLPIIYRQRFYAWWCLHTIAAWDLHAICGRCMGYLDPSPCGPDNTCNICSTWSAVQLKERHDLSLLYRSYDPEERAKKLKKDKLPTACVGQLETMWWSCTQHMTKVVKFYQQVIGSDQPEAAFDHRPFYSNVAMVMDLALASRAMTMKGGRWTLVPQLYPKWLRDHVKGLTRATKSGGPAPYLNLYVRTAHILRRKTRKSEQLL